MLVPPPSPCSGKITFYTHPPDQRSLPSHLSADIVREWGAAFDLPSLEEEERQLLSGKILVHSVIFLLKIEGWCVKLKLCILLPLRYVFLWNPVWPKLRKVYHPTGNEERNLMAFVSVA